MKKKVLCRIMLITLLASILTLPLRTRPIQAENVPLIYMDPTITAANPSEYFTVSINIADVTNLRTWQVRMCWKRGLLLTGENNIVKGSFLSESGAKSTIFVEYTDGWSYLDVAESILFGSETSGSGTLFTANFSVQDSGTSELHLYDTMLLDSAGTEILHDTSDGTFYTRVPKAQFTYSPTYPITGEDVTFNASSSYDPDGIIVNYEWDFGDGAYSEGVVTTHSYATEGRYEVTLQVADNDGFSSTAKVYIHTLAPLLTYIPVPYHHQIASYYCGPAALEMLFDFYGPDIGQSEIADVARTAPDGTYTCDMLRAAHFSDLSTSVGREMPGNITGYTGRRLGYAAFECWGMTINDLKSLIDAGYPVIVLITWHYLVAVGYSSTRIVFQDSLNGQNISMTYGTFESTWDYSGHWGLFGCPWRIEVSIPNNVSLRSIFNVTASITYPWYPPFPASQYPASWCNATVKLPTGLNLVPGEMATKIINTGFMTAGTSANVIWTVRADSPGNHTISVEAEGKVTGFMPPLPSYPEPYSYEDRIGGFNQSVVSVAPLIEATIHIKPRPEGFITPHPEVLRDNEDDDNDLVTVYIELPEGYNIYNTDVTTILMNETFPVDPYAPIAFGDYDNDGISDLMVNFERAMVESFIYNQGVRYGNVALTLTGALFNGILFEGTDVIFVNYAGDANNDGTIDIFDVGYISAHWYPGPPTGTLGYDSSCDFNNDGAVDIFDIGILSVNWGKRTP